MDKNIAAILRSDTRTIQVTFADGGNPKGYTYITDFELNPNDKVVVYANDSLKVASVLEVHNDLRIKPNSDISYKWVVCKVETGRYEESMRRNIEIENTLSVAYRANARAVYAQQLIAGAPESQRARLNELIGGDK